METNFAALTPIQKVNWARETWSAARDQMFIKHFLGKGENNVIQRITELSKTEKGEQCIFQLVADLVGDGVIGDNEREGNEEAMQSHAQIITFDQISHGVKNKGKLADQKTVITHRALQLVARPIAKEHHAHPRLSFSPAHAGPGPRWPRARSRHCHFRLDSGAPVRWRVRPASRHRAQGGREEPARPGAYDAPAQRQAGASRALR